MGVTRSLLFQREMVRALLNLAPGRVPPRPLVTNTPFKWQTRRIVREPAVARLHGRRSLPRRNYVDGTANLPGGIPNHYLHWWFGGGELGDEPCATRVYCPYGAPGERLRVRETWQAVHFSVDPESGLVDDVAHALKIPKSDEDGWWQPVYAADGTEPEDPEDRGFPWRPGRHMPRWASRIELELLSVRAERLTDITEEDAKAEGVDLSVLSSIGDDQPILGTAKTKASHPYTLAFAILWDRINADRGYPWVSDPWVWALSFWRLP